MKDKFKEVKSIEELEPEIVGIMISASGMGAMLFKWNIDYTVGAGVIADDEKCLWTKDGLRTTCTYVDGMFLISQSKEVDPLYATLEHKYIERKTK